MSVENIQYVQRKAIDDERWNRVISLSPYETAYAHTWYLDACSDQWDALILGDYRVVMPLAFRRKMGIRYLYQPRFCQQLGAYSEQQVDAPALKTFLHEMKQNFRLGDYALNEGNRLEDAPGFRLSASTNYTLRLQPGYTSVSEGYSTNCRRNLKKAAESGIVFSDRVPVEDLVLLKREHDHKVQSESHYRHLIRMFGSLHQQEHLLACGVMKDGVLCAGALLAHGTKRIHYLLSVSSRAGREAKAMFLVIDQVIRNHAGNPVCLDFEGSDIAGIARFFRGFGARPGTYQRISLGGRAAGKAQQIMNKGRHGR
jgi:hypothetical protein